MAAAILAAAAFHGRMRAASPEPPATPEAGARAPGLPLFFVPNLKTDLAVFHPSSGLWYLKYSATSTVAAIGYGGSGYSPTPGKYDADGKVDLAVYHEPTGRWFLRSSLGGGSSTSVGFGGPGYVPVN